MLLIWNLALSRHPRVLLSGIQLYFLYLWPAATKVVALRPHQNKRKPTAVPSWISLPPRNIFKQRKGRHGVKFNFDLHLCLLQPYSKMLSLPMVHPVPRKLARHPCLDSRHFLQRPQFMEP
jgi:hypothetical protein